MKHIKNLTTKDGRESSIFKMLGLAYDWRSAELADFYKVTQFQFEMWLHQMGMSDEGIRALNNPYFTEQTCFYCGDKIDELSVFCSNQCHTDAQNRQTELSSICVTGLVPVLIRDNTFYNIELQKVIYD